MDSNILIFIVVALALVAILYFAWPRKKAEPPRIGGRFRVRGRPPLLIDLQRLLCIRWLLPS